MQIINHSFALDDYFDRIAAAVRRVLIIDYGAGLDRRGRNRRGTWPEPSEP